MSLPYRSLVRVPYYPELEALPISLSAVKILSLSLFCTARDPDYVLVKAAMAGQMARHLNLSLNQVRLALGKLQRIGLFTETKSKHKSALRLDLTQLALALGKQGFELPPRLLAEAADDSRDFYAILGPQLYPLKQVLKGRISGLDFIKATHLCAEFLCTLALRDPEFLYQSLASGWNLLVQPPVSPDEVAGRWMSADARAIDIGFKDGNFFLSDAAVYGSSEVHTLKHSSKQQAPHTLGTALLLLLASQIPALHFGSDLKLTELRPALILLHQYYPKMQIELDAYYWNWHFLNPEEQALKQKEFCNMKEEIYG